MVDDALHTTLWKHQRDAVAVATSRGGTLLAMEMGTGKTLTTIAALNRLGSRRVLVVSPLSVVGVWPREFGQHSSRRWSVHTYGNGGIAARTKAARADIEVAKVRGNPVALVVNHEAVWREPFRSFALQAGWDALVIDECHRAKAPGGKLSMFLAQLGLLVPVRLGLTGTPMPHSPLDLYAQMRALDRSVYGTSFLRFRHRYALLGGYEGHQVVGFQRQDELMAKLRSAAYFARKNDVLDLPEEVDSVLPVTLEEPARKIYDSLERNFWAEVESGEVTASNAIVKLLRLQQVTSGALPDDDGVSREVSSAKRLALSDYLEDLAEPIVVFGRFRRDLDVAQAVAEGLGRTYGEVSGRRKDLTPEARMPDVDILGVQIQAGGVGIDLTRARIGVFLSCGYSLGDYLQARSRLHRPGQTRSVLFTHVLAEGTLDERIYVALRRREEVITTLLTGRGAQSEEHAT